MLDTDGEISGLCKLAMVLQELDLISCANDVILCISAQWQNENCTWHKAQSTRHKAQGTWHTARGIRNLKLKNTEKDEGDTVRLFGQTISRFYGAEMKHDFLDKKRNRKSKKGNDMDLPLSHLPFVHVSLCESQIYLRSHL